MSIASWPRPSPRASSNSSMSCAGRHRRSACSAAPAASGRAARRWRCPAKKSEPVLGSGIGQSRQGWWTRRLSAASTGAITAASVTPLDPAAASPGRDLQLAAHRGCPSEPVDHDSDAAQRPANKMASREFHGCAAVARSVLQDDLAHPASPPRRSAPHSSWSCGCNRAIQSCRSWTAQACRECRNAPWTSRSRPRRPGCSDRVSELPRRARDRRSRTSPGCS